MQGKLILLDGSTVAADVAAVEQALADKSLLWLDLDQADEDGIALLRDVFHFHPLVIDDVTEFGQRPKVEDFGDMVYLVNYGIAADGKSFSEVHFFVAADYLVTARKQGCPSIDQLRDRLDKPGGRLPTGDRPTRLILLHHLVDGLVDSFFPPLSELDDRIDDLQEQIFSRPTTAQLAQLFDLQRWLVNARKLVAPQRDMLASLVAGMVVIPGTTAESDPYLRDLYDHLIRIGDMIDTYRDLLSNAMSAYLSMVSNRLNEVMKQLTIIATVFLPLSFLTGFFGQNFGWLVDRLGGLPTFLIVGIGTEVVAVAALYWLFRRRGWMGGGT
ncbi:MAG TPA: magnesium transporter CorA family protein [Streptosporangiaceae bacterium]|nr:magnesium transporter CorA family protein [Streptosporangiaceae bacterium]